LFQLRRGAKNLHLYSRLVGGAAALGGLQIPNGLQQSHFR